MTRLERGLIAITVLFFTAILCLIMVLGVMGWESVTHRGTSSVMYLTTSYGASSGSW